MAPVRDGGSRNDGFSHLSGPHKLATDLGVPAIKALGYETKETFVQKKLYLLQSYR